MLLITHDRHVIRSTADGIVEVDDDGVRFFDGTYEELLERGAPKARTAAAPSTIRQPERAVKNSAKQAADKKRAAAERRNSLHQATKALKREVRKVEQALGKAEAEVADLTRQLADPAVYEDGENVQKLLVRHAAAKDEAATLFDRWEAAQTKLETAEAAVS